MLDQGCILWIFEGAPITPFYYTDVYINMSSNIVLNFGFESIVCVEYDKCMYLEAKCFEMHTK
jgi:hypothetical protein